MSETFTDVLRIYLGSDGAATKALYDRLDAIGGRGAVALNLFRACKASERAKIYRGGRRGFRGSAYDKKDWSIRNLCTVMQTTPAGVTWGWGVDSMMEATGSPYFHVLYVDLPAGQVSFHVGSRGPGPDHPHGWDGRRGQGAERICRFVAGILDAEKRAAVVHTGLARATGNPVE